MNNEELQALAVELAALDRERDCERVRTIQEKIAEYEFSLVNQGGNGKAYFPLLRRFNGAFDIDVFFDAFTDALMSALEKYRPEKGATFVTLFARILDFRLRDAYAALQEDISNIVSPSASDEDNENNIINTAPDKNNEMEAFGVPQTEFEIFMEIVPLIALRKEQEKHLAKQKRAYFEGFFTFDVTKQTREGLFSETEVTSENDALFPIMEIVVLEYLMTGTFGHMRDIARNPVKDGDLLNKRNDAMCVCYDLSKPTVVNRNKKYRELFDAIRN
ncbi:MAG: hypothetical protein LBP30_01870 [Clostridiales Family XIII bacterium]|jgi:hypothetical protein|nr:hypothetical protein [Clostridiales Family XIII bacterium]